MDETGHATQSLHDAVLAGAVDRLAAAVTKLAEAIADGFPRPPALTPPDHASPGPAKGLTTQIRPIPDYRDRHNRKWFAAPSADLEMGDTEP